MLSIDKRAKLIGSQPTLPPWLPKDDKGNLVQYVYRSMTSDGSDLMDEDHPAKACDPDSDDALLDLGSVTTIEVMCPV